MPGRPPPGRAGRIWLAQRVETARRAADLLDQKQRLLRREQRRLSALVERTGGEWRDAVGAAEVWCTRALVGGGRDELRRAAARAAAADARLDWTTRAGVTYPSTARTELAAPPPAAGTALTRTAEAYRRALDVAVRHAAAEAAAERVARELAATTRRLRAIEERWLPRLEARLAELDLQLDETEREEATRLRRVAQEVLR